MAEIAPAIVAAQLRTAVSDLRVRGLNQARKFAAELLLGMGESAYNGLSQKLRDIDNEDEPENWAESDRFEAAKAYFDVGEYLRAHALLSSAPESSVDSLCNLTHKSRFLQNYSLFLVLKIPKMRS